jgi:hypothetical protein
MPPRALRRHGSVRITLLQALVGRRPDFLAFFVMACFLTRTHNATEDISAWSRVMPRAPPIVPDDSDREVYLVLDDFGVRHGLSWREADEADTELEQLIENLLAGQYVNPVRVVAFNIAEGWSRDVTDDVARELRERCAERGEVPASLQGLLEQHGR